MKEYKVIQVEEQWEETQDTLNSYALKGWKLVCSYSGGNWLILERDLKVCKTCKK